MPLENFGSILNFAEEIEHHDMAFYRELALNPACIEQRELFEQFAADAAKNRQTVQRTRRENVTEMILEPIKDFTRQPFQVEVDSPAGMTPDSAMTAVRRLERRALNYYTEAALKIKALPEVARALATIGKKHGKHIEILDGR